MITLVSNDDREEMDVQLVLPDEGARRLILADTEGWEYHFGRGPSMTKGTFMHAATYTEEGRRPYVWWSDVLDGFARGMSVRDEPELGPNLSPLTEVALKGLAETCSQHKGFHLDEKVWAVRTLRVLWEDAHQPLDPAEIGVWAATHGWDVKHSNDLRAIVEGVRNGKSFRGYDGRAIPRDSEHARKMIAYWQAELEAT
jgi:hypothetical protein